MLSTDRLAREGTKDACTHVTNDNNDNNFEFALDMLFICLTV